MKLHITRNQILIPILVLVGAGMLILGVSKIQSHLAQLSDAQRQLRTQVDTTTGAPRSGRDPLTQPQTDLAKASSMANSTSVTNTAETTEDSGAPDHEGHGDVAASSVLPDTKTTGVLASGCLADYGKPGDQCLPAYAVDELSPDCEDVRKLFPTGIIVAGTDKFKLDKNLDKIACNGPDL